MSINVVRRSSFDELPQHPTTQAAAADYAALNVVTRARLAEERKTVSRA